MHRRRHVEEGIVNLVEERLRNRDVTRLCHCASRFAGKDNVQAAGNCFTVAVEQFVGEYDKFGWGIIFDHSFF